VTPVAGGEDARVLDALRREILRGGFGPGQRLVEADLCAAHAATRFAVRAALAALTSEGLVEVVRNRGARVREIPLTEAIEITEVRRALEGLTAARAAERATRDDARELRGYVRAMRTAARCGDHLGYSELNAALHLAIRRIADHPTSARILDQLHAQLVRHQFALSLVPGRPAVSVEQHADLVAAVASGEPAAAEAAMRRHLDSVIDALHTLGDRADLPAHPALVPSGGPT
jgi:DNA-binding GntR family transcriptional regulator